MLFLQMKPTTVLLYVSFTLCYIGVTSKKLSKVDKPGTFSGVFFLKNVKLGFSRKARRQHAHLIGSNNAHFQLPHATLF